VSLELNELESISRQIRGTVVEMSHRAKAAHLGSSLSCVDILTAVYFHAIKLDPQNPRSPKRDRFILSKGHAAASIYATLAYKGIISKDLLPGYGQPGSDLEEHPSPGKLPGIEVATGSLGHGLSISLGMALASNIQKLSFKIFVLMSDGECNEGSVWEAAAFAAAHKLDNVMAFVDFNKWQATGRSQEVMSLDPLKEKWESFGWYVHEVDGHDMKSLLECLSQFPHTSGKPVAVVAHTIKGKGVSFMEDDNNWHYRVPTAEEVVTAKKELRLL